MESLAGFTTLDLLLCGLLLIAIGGTHRIPKFAQWDTLCVNLVNRIMKSSTGFFRYLWPLGTTPVAVVLIALMVIPDRKFGILAALIYFGFVVIERFIKLRTNRIRPFQSQPNLHLGQPTRPTDPSHPSGDAMRVWFLAFTLPMAFNLPGPVFWFTCGIALTISLGRVVLGVHYPLDVIGGMGLGITGAGLTFFLVNYLN